MKKIIYVYIFLKKKEDKNSIELCKI